LVGKYESRGRWFLNKRRKGFGNEWIQNGKVEAKQTWGGVRTEPSRDQFDFGTNSSIIINPQSKGI
jgi:hypothetical protein